MKKIKNKFGKGFTIIEMIIYMAILAIYLAVLTEVFVSLTDMKLDSESYSSVNTDGRLIISRLIYDVRRTESVLLPLNVGDTSDRLNLVIGGNNYNYSTLSGNLLLNSDMLNSYNSEISSFSATRLGSTGSKNSVRVQFTLTSKTRRSGKNPESRSFITNISLR